MKLSSEEIYEAALDDAMFNTLPSRIAESLGARSCVLHWRHNDGAAEISTHSGYFTDAQMADYASNFVEHDLWTHAGMRQDRLNSATRTSDFVPSREYETSIFYNDWIRRMGDDTFYCCGSVMQTAHGFGIIGLHRGRTQPDFDEDVLCQLDRHVGHLRRMFTIRGRLASVTEHRDLLGEVFQSHHEPSLIVTSTGRLLAVNAAGEALLRRERCLRLRNGHVRPVADISNSYDRAVAAACSRADRQGSDCAIRAADGDSFALSFLPLLTPLPQPAVLVTVHVPRNPLPRNVAVAQLRELYGLSAAEADIAVRLADGQTVSRISDERRSATGTVRTQVKNVLSKMHAARQADVVRIVSACAGSGRGIDTT